MMAVQPEGSLPKQTGGWAALKAAYRFFNNPHVTPEKIGGPHRAMTRRLCADHAVVLCVQDGTDLQAVKVGGRRHGESDQYIQHSALAVTPQGHVLGILHQEWFQRVQRPADETPKQRGERWRESDVWAQTVEAVGHKGGPGLESCRLIHVCDSAADNLRFMHAATDAQVGFVVRAYQDRRVEQCTGNLWPHMAGQPVSGTIIVHLGEQRDKAGKIKRRQRDATLALRYATVRLEGPWNHSEKLQPLTVQVVYLAEVDPPNDVEPVDWMLLTSEPVNSFEEACVISGYYQKRWVIEEWHRVIKEGCRLEHSQMERAQSLECLAALVSIIAVRLLGLRDMAWSQSQGEESASPRALRRCVPRIWIEVVATVREMDPLTMTPRDFWQAIARQGGWIGRKSDGRPGWKSIWRGWYELSLMVRYAEAAAKQRPEGKRCG
jgi:hypothetical protein